MKAILGPTDCHVPRRTDYLAFGRPNFSDAEIEAVTRVMRSGWIGMGAETRAFEEELTLALDAPHVVTVNSCTSALFLALKVLEVGPGDEVICPTLTWCSTANAALFLGATPVFCDVDAKTFCATPASILERVTAKTRAVVVVHFGGLAVDVRALRAVLPAHVAIVEDAAHVFGSEYPDGRKVGGSGNLTCFSFYANKNLSTGEGGAVALHDIKLADRLRSLRQHALPIDAWKRFTHPKTILLSQSLTELGYKANYTDLQAAIGRVQLRRQPELQDRRRKNANRYLERLKTLPNVLTAQSGVETAAHARHLFSVRVSPSARIARDHLLPALRERNIGATIHYALLHQMPLYQRNGIPGLPVAEALGREILTLPISADMTPADVDYVCDHLDALLRSPIP